MLYRLSIKNYALIDHLDINFDAGLNVITGETGAGKSILLGALGLILGQRAEGKYFFNQQKKCVVEGQFSIKDYQLKSFFEEFDLDYDDDTVLRREIALDGKSRAFVNDTPVNLTVLKSLAQKLIDVHSQHSTLEINDAEFQLLVVDVMAGHQELLSRYKTNYAGFLKLQKKLADLKLNIEQAKAEQDYLQYLYDELEHARLIPDEQEFLEQELDSLNHAEEIKKSLIAATSLLTNNENAAQIHLKDTLHHLNAVERYQPAIIELITRLKSALIEVKDISDELDDLQERTIFDQERANHIQERLDLIYSLQKKHRLNSIAELLQLQNDIGEKLDHISNGDEEVQSLQQQLNVLQQTLMDDANEASENRNTIIPTIEHSLLETLREVGLNSAQIKIVNQKQEKFTKHGLDQIQILFNANQGHQLQEISKVASGGELSRLMLAIKSLIAKRTALPTIIFDEIDTGVSGEVANRVGNLMQQLANHMQVITITHLPQMASKGQAHYFVYKFTENDFTYTKLRKLNAEERVQEIAKMLSGENPKESALLNARELLQY